MLTFNPDTNIFSSSLLTDSRYIFGFSTRLLGDGRNAQVIQNFLSENEIPYTALVLPGQIHSANIADITETIAGIQKIDDTDGVITNLENVVLAVRTADCVPMIFIDKKAGIIGISHQGWRGSLKRLPEKMIRAMEKKGADPAYIEIAIGPAVGDCCYDISEDRYYAFMEEFNGFSDSIFSFRKGKRHLNLALLNYLLALQAGIKKEHVDFFPFCTSCDKNRFYSFRRDGKTGKFGEMFSFVVKRY